MSSAPPAASLESALAQASDEHHLQPWYRDCVRPLLRIPEERWPQCCGRGCEPCAVTLNAVARRTLELLDQRDQSNEPEDAQR